MTGLTAERVMGVMMVMLVLFLSGCAGGDIKEERVKWDKWLGTHKDDRVRELGLPTRCYSFRNGAEVCEWSQQGESGRVESMVIAFDQNGLACQWEYRDFYGQHRSKATCPH
jgi:hypothetical protein